MVDVQTMFLGMNKNLSFDSQFLKDKQLDGYLRVPMSKESINLDSELFDAVKTNIRQFAGVGNEANVANVANLLKLLKTHQQELQQFNSNEIITKSIMDQIMSLVSSVSQKQDEEVKQEEPKLEKKESRNKKAKKNKADVDMKDSNPESAAAASTSSQRTVIDTSS